MTKNVSTIVLTMQQTPSESVADRGISIQYSKISAACMVSRLSDIVIIPKIGLATSFE